ncbi:hypothetical protein RJ640_000291 [Escallonia rubra]|uniref:Cyclin-like domain-containing protein n=1 Tax=Escallonia rubra TaxID=112253 RepID=A0AA88RA23_9ASTE|nr:hypothetical protein RJ640_000291 [Escallonia rubra]
MPTVEIVESHIVIESHCAVCKEPFELNTEARESTYTTRTVSCRGFLCEIRARFVDMEVAWARKAEDEEEVERKALPLVHNNSNNIKVEQEDVFWEYEELLSLFSRENQQEHAHWARTEAVDWMLKVGAHFGFTALTVILSINYLDRFLRSKNTHQIIKDDNKPNWMIQLVAVTCFSLAAKVEETHVPLLVDLQVEDTKYTYTKDYQWEDEEEVERKALPLVHNNSNNIKVEQEDVFWEDEELLSLFSRENQQEHAHWARTEAVDWMLKVGAHFGFTALTVILSINYLDRFLSSKNTHQIIKDDNKPSWMIQLVAVTCLSLAAKVEETHVPLLVDLQVCIKQ